MLWKAPSAAGNRVRVTIELVDARTDQTLWSDSYDRDLTDIFAIQSEIARTIAPHGVYYGQLKLERLWDPLRKDARFDKLLAQLAPKE
jgi:hypothetical protein